MSGATATKERPWAVEEFFAWHERQEEKYELVDGFPVRMMTGASREHDRVTINVLESMLQQLRNGPCEPHTSDFAVQPFPGQIRYPDLSVECGPDETSRYEATRVRLVMEVLSPTTRTFDFMRKVAEYQRIEGLDYILLVDPDRLDVRLYARSERRNWTYREYVAMEEIGRAHV